ncbi:HAD family phosphatase [Kineococcus glutinatus]|uniref:HAD superfamily hydrolase (TIGR01509 family) n=1 Tax=Kineococcus glutinatus TaxID=1070872 RepID=A0ABP9HXF0_9ACTN
MNLPGARRTQEGSAAQVLAGVRVVLCDADGNLFPSEEPAFVASTAVTNRFLAAHGVAREYEPSELRLAATGMNFRSTALALAVEHGVPVAPGLLPQTPLDLLPAPAGDRPPLDAAALERWVQEEREAVTAHLRTALRPDPEVLGPLTAIAASHEVAAVSSSADARIAACFETTGMAGFFPPERRFSAEDSLPRPVSKPDPAVYLHALRSLGVAADAALAVEDSVAGATSAVRAGIPTVGNLQFVQPPERGERRSALIAAGCALVVTSWAEVLGLLPATAARPV